MHNETHAPSPATATATTANAAPHRPIPAAAFFLKTCRTCGQERPVRFFYKQVGCAERYRLDCIACVKAGTNRRCAHHRAEKPPAKRRCRSCRSSQPIAEFARDERCRAGHKLICRTCLDDLAARQAAQEDLNCPDEFIPHYSELREERIDLGIAIAHATCPPGHCRTREEIAAYSGLTEESVRRIEMRALWKMRSRAEKLLIKLGLEEIMEEGMRL